MSCFVENVLWKQTDCLAHLRIIWFLSYQNFSDELPHPLHALHGVREMKNINSFFSFFIKVFHLLQQSHKRINISGCDKEKKM